MIRYQCPVCERPNAAQVADASRTIPCAHCRYPLTVPEPTPLAGIPLDRPPLREPEPDPEPERDDDPLTDIRCHVCLQRIRESDLQARTVTSMSSSFLALRWGNDRHHQTAGAGFSHDRVIMCEACALAHDDRQRRVRTLAIVVGLVVLLLAGIAGLLVAGHNAEQRSRMTPVYLR